MENNEGWVKLYRKIFDNPYMNKPAYLSVWIWILTHTEYGKKFENGKWIDTTEEEMPSIIWKGERKYLKKGEFTFGILRIAKDTGVPRGTVERIINTFKNEKQIEVVSSNLFSLGLVLNWSKYQSNEEQNEKQMRNKRETNENVTKNIKNIKNNNNKTYKVKIDNGEKEFTLEEIAKRLLNLFNEVNKTKYSNIKVFISNLEKTLEIYTPIDIAKAIEHIPLGFWKDKMKPEILFRQKNPQGEPVDYIGQLLNSKQKYE